MNVRLLELDEVDQLSASKLSLLLGVYTPKNQVEDFLKFARAMLHVGSGILTFQDEPYIWHSSKQGFKVIHVKEKVDLNIFFNFQSVIDIEHENYQELSAYLFKLGLNHQRFIAFNLNLSVQNDRSIGQAILFDDLAQPFQSDEIQLVQDLVSNLIRIVEMHADFAELKEMYEQQSALNFSKTKFFQIIAHDLRAPFHGLLGFSDVLAAEFETLDRNEIVEIAQYLNDTAQSTYNLLESLLNWAMAEGGRFVYHPINFKLKDICKIVYNVLNTLALNKNIELINRIPDDLNVYADINMVTSVIQNLVSNALKFTQVDGTGKVYMEAQAGDQGVEIYIRDTGLGMTDVQIERLFQPALQVSLNGTSGEKGTGLGLVLCKRFVDINHGQITVVSKIGQGSTFKVVLPSVNQSNMALLPLENKIAQENKLTELVQPTAQVEQLKLEHVAKFG